MFSSARRNPALSRPRGQGLTPSQNRTTTGDLTMSMETPPVDIDNIIDRLLEVRGSKPGQQVDLEEHEIRYLCSKARSIFIKQPILLELEAPIKVC